MGPEGFPGSFQVAQNRRFQGASKRLQGVGSWDFRSLLGVVPIRQASLTVQDISDKFQWVSATSQGRSERFQGR